MLCYTDYRFLTKIVCIKREVWNNQSRERISSILTCRETLKLISGKTSQLSVLVSLESWRTLYRILFGPGGCISEPVRRGELGNTNICELSAGPSVCLPDRFIVSQERSWTAAVWTDNLPCNEEFPSSENW